MDTTKVMGLLRRRIADTAPEAVYDDEVLLAALEDARSLLSAKRVKGMSGYVIDQDPQSASYGFSGDVQEDHAHVLALRATLDLLGDRYRELVRTGALGVAWRSGLEEESSIQAAKAYREGMASLEREIDELVLIMNRSTSASRPM